MNMMNRYLCVYDERDENGLPELKIYDASDIIPTCNTEDETLYINDNEYRNGHNWKMWLYADSIGEATKKFLEVMRL